MDGASRLTAADLRLETLAWRVEGMDCASCVARVEKAVLRLPGIAEVRVNLMAERLTIRREADGAAPDLIERQVSALGYRPSRLPDHPSWQDGPAPEAEGPADPGRGEGNPHRQAGHHDHLHGHRPDHHLGEAVLRPPAVPAHGHFHAEDAAGGVRWWRHARARRLLVLVLLAVVAFLLALTAPRSTLAIYLVAALVAVAPLARRAIVLARAGSPLSIELLMCVAALGAVVVGAGQEALIVVLLFTIGETLETVAAGHARAGLRALTRLIPQTVRREAAGGLIEEVPASQLALGDIIQIRPGDRVAGDGEIVEGSSALDESLITGESVAVLRGPGESVVAGAVNADSGTLRIRLTRAAGDNTVARIIRLVEEAAASRAPTQRFIERFAAWWTPAALAGAALVALVPVLAGGDVLTWVYRALALLLIACPCALVISVPAAVASGLSAGARRGLLVKGGAALEALASARTVAFDKTGTLTEGRPRVLEVVALRPGYDENALLRLAAAVETGASHPLGRAILERAAARGITLPVATAGRVLPGRAVQAVVEGQHIEVASPLHAVATGAMAGLEPVGAMQAAGQTVVAVLIDGAACGLIALQDALRADAASGVAALRALGITPVMLTGDHARSGRLVADRLGLDVRAQLLPEDKLREIGRLKQHGAVIMVGDGINDAPALAAATVGIAMGGGADLVVDYADAALLHERVSGVAELIALSRATLTNIRQNVAMALGLKALFLGTTLLGVTGLWPAILADTGATVLVTLNALRLLRWSPK
jgi:Cd2+/Zn2+-exporting ATPase